MCHFITGGKVADIPEQSVFLGMDASASAAVAVRLVSNLHKCEAFCPYSDSRIRNMKKASVLCFALDVNIKKKKKAGKRTSAC